MVISEGETTMNRNTNFHCLWRLLDAYEQTSDEKARLRIRQAMYIHGIVDAVLSDRIDLLPEVSLASRSSRAKGWRAAKRFCTTVQRLAAYLKTQGLPSGLRLCS